MLHTELSKGSVDSSDGCGRPADLVLSNAFSVDPFTTESATLRSEPSQEERPLSLRDQPARGAGGGAVHSPGEGCVPCGHVVDTRTGQEA